MKKILSTLALVPLFLVVSFAVGYGIGTLLGGGSQESIDLLKLFKAVVLCAVALVGGDCILGAGCGRSVLVSYVAGCAGWAFGPALSLKTPS